LELGNRRGCPECCRIRASRWLSRESPWHVIGMHPGNILQC
jgi:hypothetical protein